MALDFEQHSKKTGEYLQSIIDENMDLRKEMKKQQEDQFAEVQLMQKQMADM